MTGTMDGTFAIGMASRELKDEEAAQLTGTAIALDGIAVIVNPANTIDELSMDQIKSIYVGDITTGATSRKTTEQGNTGAEYFVPFPMYGVKS